MSTNLQIIFFTIGVLLLTLGGALLFPFILDLYDGHENASAFGWSAIFAIFVGGGLCISNSTFPRTLSIRGAFLMTISIWFVVSFFSAIPLYISDLGLSMTDAIFESVSGVTTTGATILTGLDDMSRGILLWRSITGWIGGIGIVAFAMILLPFLKIGGMQLFRAESSDRSEKILPRTTNIVWSIIYVYLFLTASCFIVYNIFGMPRFEAIVHAMTTVATAGFSSHDNSLAFYDSYAIHMAATLFMFMGGVPFILYVKYVYQGSFDFHKDSQVRIYGGILLTVITLLTLHLWFNDIYSLADSFRYAAFNVTSIITTTGYAASDYSLWGAFPVSVFFFVTYIGGCAGSTSGGIKMLRVDIAFQALNRHLKTLIYPNGTFTASYQGKPLSSDVINAVMGFLFLFVFFNVVLTVALTLTGLDFMTAMTGAASAMANVGPGLGDTIGPSGNYSTLPTTAKWLLCLGMLLGRLEVLTMLVLVTPSFWRN